MDNVKRLPDSYRKDIGSNNDNMLKLNEIMGEEYSNDMQDVMDSLDISKATGVTLDLYGQMLGQKRGQLNDDQYRYMIYVRIARNISTGDINNIVTLISMILQADISLIKITEVFPAKIEVLSIPLGALILAGYSVEQMVALINLILPAGVSVATANFEGTFEFDEADDTYDELKGFADDAQTIGGYLGIDTGDISKFPLPI